MSRARPRAPCQEAMSLSHRSRTRDAPRPSLGATSPSLAVSPSSVESDSATEWSEPRWGRALDSGYLR